MSPSPAASPRVGEGQSRPPWPFTSSRCRYNIHVVTSIEIGCGRGGAPRKRLDTGCCERTGMGAPKGQPAAAWRGAREEGEGDPCPMPLRWQLRDGSGRPDRRARDRKDGAGDRREPKVTSHCRSIVGRCASERIEPRPLAPGLAADRSPRAERTALAVTVIDADAIVQRGAAMIAALGLRVACGAAKAGLQGGGT